MRTLAWIKFAPVEFEGAIVTLPWDDLSRIVDFRNGTKHVVVGTKTYEVRGEVQLFVAAANYDRILNAEMNTAGYL